MSASSNGITVIITTSPTPSSPSTDLVSSVLRSFRQHCGHLLSCPVIVVFDTFDHIDLKARLKKGRVTDDCASNFEIYKANVKSLIISEYLGSSGDGHNDEWTLSKANGEAEFGYEGRVSRRNAVPLTTFQTSNGLVTFIEPEERLGFGLAVRSALRITKTPFVWIQQHDWPLCTDIPVLPLLDVMQDSLPKAGTTIDEPNRDDAKPPIKYVCLPSIRLLSYTASFHVNGFPALRKLTVQFKRDYTSQDGVSVPLTPMFLWHDKPHIALTSHYLERVFPTRLAMARGAFIEDSIGQRARSQMKDGLWSKWACWLFYPADGKAPCVTHLNGRKWGGVEATKRKQEEVRVLQMEKAGIQDVLELELAREESLTASTEDA